MNSEANPLLALAWTFALMSLFAVGGASAAIPEMHRVAVDVQHWLTDRQFADIYAISQLSPGPNVLIVTLIGYSVAGVAGALNYQPDTVRTQLPASNNTRGAYHGAIFAQMLTTTSADLPAAPPAAPIVLDAVPPGV